LASSQTCTKQPSGEGIVIALAGTPVFDDACEAHPATNSEQKMKPFARRPFIIRRVITTRIGRPDNRYSGSRPQHCVLADHLTVRVDERQYTALPRRDTYQLFSAARAEDARSSLVLFFSLTQQPDERRLLAGGLQPGIARKRREAAAAAGDDALEEVDGGIGLIQMGQMPR
jgi:hypothetical protein